MGLFRLAARVGRLSPGASLGLEEWSPSPSLWPGWTEPGLQALWHHFTPPAGGRGKGPPRNFEHFRLVTPAMARSTRNNDWGFPRWRSYADKGREAARIRLCDREGCDLNESAMRGLLRSLDDGQAREAS